MYLPLSRLLPSTPRAAQTLHGATSDFLGTDTSARRSSSASPGRSRSASRRCPRLLRELLRRWEDTPRVELVTTDGFLLPNAELERRGLMERKGFPESYDRRALLRFVSEVKSGSRRCAHRSTRTWPTTSCRRGRERRARPTCSSSRGSTCCSRRPPARSLAVSDLFDFTIYVDARTSDIARWYVERFLSLQRGAFADPRRTSTASRRSPRRRRGRRRWTSGAASTSRTCEQNILPTRARASLVLRKAANHTVETVLLRKM